MTLAALGYKTVTVVTGETAVGALLAEFVADPNKAKLMYDTSSGEFIDPSTTTPNASAGVHMATRTSVPHFADLLQGQNVHTLVRVTPFSAQSDFGHLVAIGPQGFHLCTCLRQLVYGLLCPHGLRALFDRRVECFNGADISPRWRESDTPWTMAALAAKPARLATAGADCSGELPPVDPNPTPASHPGPNLSAAAYANGIAVGKELGVMLKELPSLAAVQRVCETAKTFLRQQIDGEKRSHRNESTSRVYTGAFSQPTPVEAPGGAGGTGRGAAGRCGRGQGGRQSRGRGGGAGARGGRSGGESAGSGGRTGGRGGRGEGEITDTPQGRGRRGAGGEEGGGSGGMATGMPSPPAGVPAVQAPTAAATAAGIASVCSQGGAGENHSSPVPGVCAVQPAAAAAAAMGTTSATPSCFQTTPVNGTLTSAGSDMPLRSLPNVCVPGRRGQASSSLPSPAHLAVLENVLPPDRQQHVGQSKRHCSSWSR